MSKRSTSGKSRSSAPAGRGTWQSWSGSVTADPAVRARPENTDQVVQVLHDAAAQGRNVRPVGAGHSFSPLSVTNDVLLDLSGLQGVASVDHARQQVTVLGGTTLQQLNKVLEENNLALANLPDSMRQTVAGTIATGTHGTGLGQPSMAGQVVGLTLITAAGELLECSENENQELFQAARTHLGVLGVVVSVTLQCVDRFRLHCSEFREPVSSLVDALSTRMSGADHFEFFWMPGTDVAHTRILSRLHRLPDEYTRPASPISRALRRTDDAVLRTSLLSGLGRVGSVIPQTVPGLNKLESMAVSSRRYTDISYRAFTAPRAVKFVALEYAFPLAATAPAFTELQELVDRDGYTLSFPVLVRCSPPDRAPLSPAYGRYTGWISLRQYGKRPHREFFRAAEDIFLRHGGRPHWGTAHTLGAQELTPLYPEWDRFLTVREQVDPDGLFLDHHVRALLGR